MCVTDIHIHFQPFLVVDLAGEKWSGHGPNAYGPADQISLARMSDGCGCFREREIKTVTHDGPELFIM